MHSPFRRKCRHDDLTLPVAMPCCSCVSLLQGDGTAQFICRSADDQAAVCGILERDLGMHCTRLTLQPTSSAHSTAEAEVTVLHTGRVF